MKRIKKMAAQGDVLFRRVSKVPDTAKAVESKKDHVIAHSETGHHHTVSSAGAEFFTAPGDTMTSYLRLKNDYVDVIHHRPFDTHETLRLLKDDSCDETIFEIRRQREHTPEGWRRVED